MLGVLSILSYISSSRILRELSAGGSNETVLAMFVTVLCCAVLPLCHLLEVKGGWMGEDQKFVQD